MCHTSCPAAFDAAASSVVRQIPSLRRLSSSLAVVFLFAPAISHAAPLIFEESAILTAPDPAFTVFPKQIAVEGDTIIATGIKFEGNLDYHVAFLYRRQSDGTWAYQRTLAQTYCDTGELAEDTCIASVSIRNGVAAVAAGSLHVFERAPNGDWVEVDSNGSTGPGDVAVGGSAILTSEPTCDGVAIRMFQENSAGVWNESFSIPPIAFCDFWGRYGGDVDMSADDRFVISEDNGIHLYEPTSSSWTLATTLNVGSGGSAAIDGDRVFVSSTLTAPIREYARNEGAWSPSTAIVLSDIAERSGTSEIRARGTVVVAGFPRDRHRGGSVSVFRKGAGNDYDEVAKLVSSSADQSLGRIMDADVSDSLVRVVASGAAGVHVFDVPALGVTPAPLQDNFEQGNAANWTLFPGSNFTVVSSGGSKVYRQSSLTGDAGAFYTSIDWTDQAIEADVKPTEFTGSNRWVGLVVRRTDAANFYYITLRKSNVLDLKRIVNGTYITLASAPVDVVLNRTYRLRLEAIGTRLRAYVNGKLVAEAQDTQLTHGHAGIQMYQARADYDNVILSRNPHLTLIDHRSLLVALRSLWSLDLGAWGWSIANNQQRLTQSDLAGDGRAVNLIPANDQIVQVRATPTTFASGDGRWVGVVARYVDANNFYYVTVRKDNTISLRKFVNGVIHILDTTPMTVATGTTYTLRFEAVGSALRAYVNGRLMVEANDTSLPRGRYGLATYKASARFDNFLAWEP